MFDIGGGELLLILLIVVVFFGPKKLPELMQGVGKGMREFKKAQREFTEHINSAFEDEQRNTYRSNTRRPLTDAVPRRVPERSIHVPDAPTNSLSSDSPHHDVNKESIPAQQTDLHAEDASSAKSDSISDNDTAPPKD